MNTDTAASTVSGAGAASSFSGGTGTEAEFGSLGALSPTWWEPEDGSEPEPWLTPDQAFERFFEWTSDRGIELWDHQEEALMDLAALKEADLFGVLHDAGKFFARVKQREPQQLARRDRRAVVREEHRARLGHLFHLADLFALAVLADTARRQYARGLRRRSVADDIFD